MSTYVLLIAAARSALTRAGRIVVCIIPAFNVGLLINTLRDTLDALLYIQLESMNGRVKCGNAYCIVGITPLSLVELVQAHPLVTLLTLEFDDLLTCVAHACDVRHLGCVKGRGVSQLLLQEIELLGGIVVRGLDCTAYVAFDPVKC